MNSIDIETYGDENLIPYCMCFLYKNKPYVFYGLNCVKSGLTDMFNIVSSKTVFYAHNLTFDGSMILQHIPDDFSIINTSLRNGNLYTFTILGYNKVVVFKCSQKILPLKLIKIANTFDLPAKMDFNHDLINENTFKDKDLMKKVVKYCIRDVEIVSLFLKRLDLILNNVISDWFLTCLSLSGISLRVFELNFNNCKIKLKTPIKIDNILREGYYGGRCEVFGNSYENEQVYHFDFTGMYTQIMNQEFPLGYPTHNSKPIGINKIGFYRVKVRSNINNIPILPCRDCTNNKLIFPNGIFTGLYWWEELALFKENGGEILEFIESFEFEKSDFTFKKFSDFCVENRKNSKAENVVWKNIANSFIGRLGIKPENETNIVIKLKEYDVMKYKDRIISETIVGNIVIVRVKSFKKVEFISGNVIYPAIVTSKARIKWWNGAQSVIKQGGRVLYCDTDSLFVAFNKNQKILDKKMGDIYWDSNKKDTIIKKSLFVAPKVYSIIHEKDIVKIKGVDSNALNFEQFEKLVKENKLLNIGVKSFLKKNLHISIKDVYKNIVFSNYDKRIFKDNMHLSDPLII